MKRLAGLLMLVMVLLCSISTNVVTAMGTTGEDASLSTALNQVCIFEKLTPSERDIVGTATTLRHVKAGERITRKGQTPEKMFVILDGEAEVWVHGNLVVTLSGQVLIGETEFLNKDHFYEDVIVTKDTHIIELNNAQLAVLMEKHPRIGYVILGEMAVIESQRLRDTTLRKYTQPDIPTSPSK